MPESNQPTSAVADVVFMDTETLGVQLDAPIWEFAAIRRSIRTGAPLGVVETELRIFIHHEVEPWYATLPEQFQKDYTARFDGSVAEEQFDAAHRIHRFMSGRPHIVGAVPNFDTERILRQLLHPAGLGEPWHYHLVDVENLVVGFLRGLYAAQGQGMSMYPPWKSDELSEAVGVDPGQFERHTALGDVLWVRAQFDAVMGAPDA